MPAMTDEQIVRSFAIALQQCGLKNFSIVPSYVDYTVAHLHKKIDLSSIEAASMCKPTWDAELICLIRKKAQEIYDDLVVAPKQEASVKLVKTLRVNTHYWVSNPVRRRSHG
jgi:hypothetical protein